MFSSCFLKLFFVLKNKENKFCSRFFFVMKNTENIINTKFKEQKYYIKFRE